MSAFRQQTISDFAWGDGSPAVRWSSRMSRWTTATRRFRRHWRCSAASASRSQYGAIVAWCRSSFSSASHPTPDFASSVPITRMNSPANSRQYCWRSRPRVTSGPFFYSVYEPEEYRFGGPVDAMDLVHDYFDADTSRMDAAAQQIGAAHARSFPAASLLIGVLNDLFSRLVSDEAEVWDLWCQLTTLLAATDDEPVDVGRRFSVDALLALAAPQEVWIPAPDTGRPTYDSLMACRPSGKPGHFRPACDGSWPALPCSSSIGTESAEELKRRLPMDSAAREVCEAIWRQSDSATPLQEDRWKTSRP